MIPKPAEKKEAKSVDYLALLRKAREDDGKPEEKDDDIVNFEWDEKIQNLPEEERLKIIKKQSKHLERALKKKELALSNTTATAQSLKFSDDINEMLIGNIKAKLAVLEKKNEEN